MMIYTAMLGFKMSMSGVLRAEKLSYVSVWVLFLMLIVPSVMINVSASPKGYFKAFSLANFSASLAMVSVLFIRRCRDEMKLIWGLRSKDFKKI